MSRRFHKVLGSLTAASTVLVVASCQTESDGGLTNIVPRIYDIDDPDVNAPLQSLQPVELSATYNLGTWATAQTEKAFGYSRLRNVDGQIAAPTRGPGANILGPSAIACQPNGQNRERCTVRFTPLLTGTYRFQWFLERLDAGPGDDSLIEAPVPYGDFSFVIGQPNPPDEDPPDEDPPEQPEANELIAFEPMDGSTCAGDITPEGVYAWLIWRRQSAPTDDVSQGSFQYIAEPVDNSTCGSVDLDNPNMPSVVESCLVGRVNNIGRHYVGPFTPGATYEWRVREILSTNPPIFGNESSAARITMARKLESEDIVFTNPPPPVPPQTLPTIDIGGTNANVTLEWTTVGCPATNFDYVLTGGLAPIVSANGKICSDGLCRLPIEGATAPNTYLLDLTQRTQFGEAQKEITFNTVP